MRSAFGLAAAAAASLGLAAMSSAQTVEVRLVERHARTLVTGPSDAALDIAVQARVVGATTILGIGEITFNVHIVGEPESNGTLALGLISNLDHTYSSDFGVGATVGRFGLASQYSYLAGINPGLNGLINRTGGSFTNGPDQEIGAVSGASDNGALLNTPGVDADGNGLPDAWSGNATGATPPNGATATLDPAVMSAYFGATASWIDVYRCRYTVSNFTPRTLLFRLDAPRAYGFTQVTFSNGVWGTPGAAMTVSVADLSIAVAVPDLGTCCDISTGACAITHAADCTGAFFAEPTCTPTSCPAVGRCCDLAGACYPSFQAFCNSTWSPTGACDPGACPQPTACCAASGACTMLLASVCPPNLAIPGAACSPSPCPPLGHCCATYGTCTVMSQPFCSAAYIWSTGGACTTNICVRGTCCSNTSGACTFLYTASCPTTATFNPSTTCTTGVCPLMACCNTATRACTTTGPSGTCPVGTLAQGPSTSCTVNICPGQACCSTAGACTLIGASARCTTGLTSSGPATTCTPNPCPQRGRCCAATGACTLVLQSLCTRSWSAGSCSPACPQPGACCAGTSCLLALQSACPAGSTWRGPATSCGTAANPLDCCPANFNRVNGIDVQDIFDFSSAWFNHDPAADFDHDGTTTVTDFMQFLAAWTAGCS